MPSLPFAIAGAVLAANIAYGAPTNAQNNNDIIQSLRGVTPTASPTSPAQVLSQLQSIQQATPTPASEVDYAQELIGAGLVSENIDSTVAYLSGLLTGEDNTANINLRNPSPPAYPKAGSNDAPYDLSEAALRAAIHIPPNFQYGAKGAPQPIILIPGTGATGYETFSGNYIPLLQGSDIGDPVWLNIPGQLLNDIQTNAEYAAYAINYIYGISNKRKVAIMSWSQGAIDAQWAYKYWPSTRTRVTDQISFSPDYHGSIVATVAKAPGAPLPPSLIQQAYESNFIHTLRANGGDSAYVPTTTIYSGLFDEVVEPQQGTGASAFINDARNIGVTNNEVQTICAFQPAGGLYTHEGILYNNLGFALAVDALRHDGPGRPERLDLASVCALPVTERLDLADVIETENVIPIALVSIALYPNSVSQEPPIKSYAQ